QGIELEDLKHKNIILDTINLTQSSTNLKKCVNDSDIGNDVTSTIKKFAESENIIKVKNDTSTSNTSDTNQNTKQQDVIENVGNAISNIVDSITFGIFSS